MKDWKEARRSVSKAVWLCTALVLGALGAVVGYLGAPNAPLLEHHPSLCAALGGAVCVAFVSVLYIADIYSL